MNRFFLICGIVFLSIVGIFSAGNLLPLARESKNTEGEAVLTITPRLAVPFGETVYGTIGEIEPVSPAGFVVKIENIKGGKTIELLVDSCDITLYDEGGIRKDRDALLDYIGEDLRFYEAGRFYSFPDEFWGKRCPISTGPRGFGFFSTFTFLLPDKTKQRGVGSKKSSDNR